MKRQADVIFILVGILGLVVLMYVLGGNIGNGGL